MIAADQTMIRNETESYRCKFTLDLLQRSRSAYRVSDRRVHLLPFTFIAKSCIFAGTKLHGRMIHRTLVNLKRARVVIPQLSPTFTKARVYKWLKDPKLENQSIESCEPLFVLECSPDLLSTGYRKDENDRPLMLIEAQEDGVLNIHEDVLQDKEKWYPVGHVLGEINDDEDDDDLEVVDWLWQAYSYSEEEEQSEKDVAAASVRNRKENYAVFGVIELKGMLRARGLDVTGNTKEELLARLQEDDEKSI
eukprot:scaffold16721_cov84-Cylindrotheca_fusiformis.AAC.1